MKDKFISLRPGWMEVNFPGPQMTLSWAIVGGGWSLAHKVIWHQVNNQELTMEVDAKDYFQSKLQREFNLDRNGPGVVGLLTSAPLEELATSFHSEGDAWARCVATIGLGNAVRVGDFPLCSPSYGTINVLLQVSKPLTLNASLEAMSLVAEARTLAVLEGNVPSMVSPRAATGTGTDCIVVSSPMGEREGYAGKHTSLGHLIGRTAYEAIAEGVSNWKYKWREVLASQQWRVHGQKAVHDQAL